MSDDTATITTGAPAASNSSNACGSPSVCKMYDLFPNTKPANGKYVGVISGLLRNLAPRDVLASASPFQQAGAVHDATQDAANGANSTVNNSSTASAPNASFGSAPTSPSASQRRELDLLEALCSDAKKVLDEESVIINVKVEANDRLVLVGDIHGQFRDLQRHVLSPQRDTKLNSDLKAVEGVDCKYLFLGDYVDRGPQGVEVITLLLALKVEYPNNVFMIRGNHEDAQVSRLYGFLAECKNKLDISSWSKYNEVFNSLPLGATVECEKGTIFCCHGGLSPMVEHVASLQFLNRAEYGSGLTDESGEAIDGLLWSDPGEHKGFRRNMRGCGYTFGVDTTKKFCEENGLAFVCRAHQMVMAGYQWEHDHKLLTLFSAPNYCGINHNNGAIGILLGSVANERHIAAVAEKKKDKAAKDDAEALAEDELAGNIAAGIEIPIVFYSFASAPSEPCTLYYTTADSEPSPPGDECTPDANGSPVLSGLPSVPSVSLAGCSEDGEIDAASIPSATPRPNPNSAIEGLAYFKDDTFEKKDDGSA